MYLRRKRSQAAMEFLMTYGWAILVVLIVIGALAYFGVITPDSLMPERCSLGVGLGCNDFSVTEDDIQLKISNNGGREITINNINITSDALGNPCSNSFQTNIKNGEIATFLIVGCPAQTSETSKKRYAVEINYKYTDSSIDRIADGELIAKRNKKVPLFFDNFDSGLVNWNMPIGGCGVVYSDGGNNVLKSTCWSPQYSRTIAGLSDGGYAKFDFRQDPGSDVFYVFFPPSGYRGIQATVDGYIVAYGGDAETLIYPIVPGKYYTVYIKKIQNNGGFYIKVYQKDNPMVYGETIVPNIGTQSSRFNVYTNGVSYLDNYMES